MKKVEIWSTVVAGHDTESAKKKSFNMFLLYFIDASKE